MPDPRDFLPQPPWEGPPIPRFLSRELKRAIPKAEVTPAPEVKFTNLKTTEVQRIQGLLENLPPNVKTGITEIRQQFVRGGRGSQQAGVIKLGKDFLDYTFYHEVGHHIYDDLAPKQFPELITEWSKRWKHPQEQFSNSFADYMTGRASPELKAELDTIFGKLAIPKAAVSPAPEVTNAEIMARPPRPDQIGSTMKPVVEEVGDIGGFEQTLAPVNRTKAIAQMNERKIIAGKPQSRKEYIEGAVSRGAVVGMKEGQPALVFPDGRYMRQSEITKTALDYASYLKVKPAIPKP